MTGEPRAAGRAEVDADSEAGFGSRDAAAPREAGFGSRGAAAPREAVVGSRDAPGPREASAADGPEPCADREAVVADSSDDAPAGGTPGRSSGGSFLRELPVLVVIALLLALLIKAFLVQAFYIPSGSMEQTLQIGDRVLVNKLVYRFRDIRRGEVVVFDGRTSSFQPEVIIPEPTNPVARVVRGVQGALGLGATGERDFIKRVIGLPGDTVVCCDEQGRISVNGEVLEEPYLYEDDQRPFGPVTVPEGRIFVLGDHRGASQDSRAYLANPDVGSVPIDRVIGRAFVVVWPVGSAQVLERPETFAEVPDPATARSPLPAAALAAAPPALGATAAVPLRRGTRLAAAGVPAGHGVRPVRRAGERP